MKFINSFCFFLLLCITPHYLYCNTERVLDYYGALGVDRTTPSDDIKKAFKILARNNHPDKFPGDKAKEETFKLVSEAWEVLGDESKKARYDAFFVQFGRLPTVDEFSTLDEFRAERAAAAEAEARAPQAVYTHQSTQSADPVVDDFLRLVRGAITSYDSLKPEDFFKSFSQNHAHVEGAFLKIMNNPKLSKSDKHLAFTYFYDTYAYSTLKKQSAQLSAHNTLSLMNMLEAPLENIQKNLGPDYVESARSYVAAVATEVTLAHAQDGKFMGELAQLLRNSKKNTVWSWLNILARPQFNRETTVQHIADNSTLYPILIKYLVADGDSKHALLLLESSMTYLNKMAVKVQSQDLNERENFRIRAELAVIEELVHSKEAPELMRKAKEFFLSDTYVELKESVGEEVPVRHQSVADLQSLIEKNLETLDKLSGAELLDSKRGVNAFLMNALGVYRGVLQDHDVDNHGRAQAQGLILEAISSSLHLAAMKVPLDLETELAAKIEETFKAQRLEGLLSASVASIFTDKISQLRKGELIRFIEQNLRSAKSTNKKLALQIIEKYRNSVEALSTETLNQLLAQGEANVEVYRPLFNLWERDLSRGSAHPFYNESKGLLLHAASLKKQLPKVADLANSSLVKAQRSLATPELRGEILSNMKTSGYGCFARLKAWVKTRE